MTVKRTQFLVECFELLHTPYIYGGRSDHGVDCWGFVSLSWSRSGGPDRSTWWTDRAWAELSPIKGETGLMPGDLAFYGGSKPDDVEHVMVVGPLLTVIGASGGDSTTKSLIEAFRRGAKVKAFPHYREGYRSDFRGFRRMPFL